MKKTTKGALAAAAAGVLLVGGAGSLAYWTATGSVDSDSIQSGKLALVNATPGSWELNGAPADNTVKIVPGDEVVYQGSYEIDAEGENIRATLAVTGGTEGGALAPAVTTTMTSTINGVALTEITAANDGETLDVVVSIDFPFGTTVDNTSQDQTLSLDDIAISLTQVDETPTP